MSELRPDKEWWTPQDLADAALPGLPRTKRNINALAAREGWKNTPDKTRRAGRGGGLAYHWTLLPLAARTALLVTSKEAPKAPLKPNRSEVWEAYEARPDHQKKAAMERLDIIQQVEALEGSLTKRLAVSSVASLHEKSVKTIWNWLAMIDGVERQDRLAYLVPKQGNAAVNRANIDPDFFNLVMSDYLRPSPTSLSAAYRRQCRVATNKGIPIAPLHVVRREKTRRVSPATEVLARKGIDALKAMYPAQTRDKTALHALEAVNADFHKFDVFVLWPGETEPTRPQMVAVQDIYSGRIVNWRVDKTPNAQTVQLCFGDMVETWGIPAHVVLDNGREFAAKTITGGARSRFRYTVREDDIPGLLTSLGCEIHWATPYSGQSKPIERAFRDMCDDIAMDPRFDGAYTGNAPHAKPENYGKRAVSLDDFLSVLAEGIEEHNTRQDRRSEVAWGRSFAEVFDESYAVAPIRKATEQQRRMWLLGADGVKVDSRNGSIKFMKNVYFDEILHNHLGKKLIARFDTGALRDGLHVYTLADEYIGHIPCKEKVGFFDIEEGKQHLRARKAWMKAEKERLKAMNLQRAADLGRQLDTAAATNMPEPTPPETKVVQLVQPRERTLKKAQTPVPTPADIAQIEDRIERRKMNQIQDDTRALFLRARELEKADGASLTPEQSRWLASFQSSAEYRTWKDAVALNGEQVLGKGAQEKS